MQKSRNAVSKFVNDGDTVFINSDTTATKIIKALINKNIRMVTNHTADGSKLGKTFGFNTSAIDKLDILVLDHSANSIEIYLLMKAGLEIVLVDTN